MSPKILRLQKSIGGLTRSFMMLDISAVLRTGDRLTPDTRGWIFIGSKPLSLVSVPGSGCLVQFGSSAEAGALCPPPPAVCSRSMRV